ncbi:MAG: hypothetical protein AB9866_14470 [Syntrophobacteraceae bacterium]
MKKWKLWAGLTAIFLSGVVVGFTLGGAHTKRALDNMLSGEHTRSYDVIVSRLDRELKLSESQRAHVESIVCRTHAELFKIRQMHQPDIERIISGGIAEMKEKLTDEQGRQLDAFYERAKNRWGRWKGRVGKTGQPECK